MTSPDLSPAQPLMATIEELGMNDDYCTDDMDQEELDDYSRAMNPHDNYDFDDFENDHSWDEHEYYD